MATPFYVILKYKNFPMYKSNLYVAFLLFVVSSCITPKIHNALIDENELAKSQLQKQELKNLKQLTQIEELNVDISEMIARVSSLESDSIKNEIAVRNLNIKYNNLSESYDLLMSKKSRDISDKAKEIKRLIEKLDQVQSELFSKEDELSKISASLEIKENELQLAIQDLEERSVRVSELESIISNKDSLVTALKTRITNALIGLEGDGLTILQRNGKVYISLEEKLLFASGKYTVNATGINALNKLSNVLETQTDLEILVEGHTDSIPFNSRGAIADNWDLSVLRATNVVKVLTQNSNLSPLQLTAAGRAEFVPIASNKTVEGRSSNRRIEMILSPNLDDLFKLLEE